jgi:hypothetical protein
MHVLSDYVWQADDGTHCGVFVFSCGGLLAGVEVWSADGMEVVARDCFRTGLDNWRSGS